VRHIPGSGPRRPLSRSARSDTQQLTDLICDSAVRFQSRIPCRPPTKGSGLFAFVKNESRIPGTTPCSARRATPVRCSWGDAIFPSVLLVSHGGAEARRFFSLVGLVIRLPLLLRASVPP
jgi:hypothetical protein